MTSLITQPSAQKFSIAVPLQALETVFEFLGKSVKLESKEELLIPKTFRRLIAVASKASMIDTKTGIPLFPLNKLSKMFLICKFFCKRCLIFFSKCSDEVEFYQMYLYSLFGAAPLSQKACIEKILELESRPNQQHHSMPLYSTVVRWLLFRQPLPHSCHLSLAEKAQAWKEVSTESSLIEIQRQFVQKFIRFCFVRDTELETTKSQLYQHMSVSYLNVVTSDLPSTRKWFLCLYDRIVDDGLQSCSASEDEDEEIETTTVSVDAPSLTIEQAVTVSKTSPQVRPAMKKPMQILEVVSQEREKKKVTFSEELKSYEIESDPVSEDALLECLSPSGNPSLIATQRAIQLMSKNANSLEGQVSLLSSQLQSLEMDATPKTSSSSFSSDWYQIKQEDVLLTQQLDQIVEREAYKNDFNLKSIIDNVKKSYWLVSHQLDQEIETKQEEEKKSSLAVKKFTWIALIKYIIVLLLSSSLFVSSFVKFMKRMHV